MSELSKELKRMALSNGLCDKWAGEWKDDDDVDVLLTRYLDGIDFCIKHDWPTNKYIENHFDKAILRSFGIFVNDYAEWVNATEGRYVFLGNSHGELVVAGRKVVDVVVRHDVTLYIKVKDNASVHVKVLDNASVCVDSDSAVTAYVERYGGKVALSGNVAEKEKHFEDVFGI